MKNRNGSNQGNSYMNYSNAHLSGGYSLKNIDKNIHESQRNQQKQKRVKSFDLDNEIIPRHIDKNSKFYRSGYDDSAERVNRNKKNLVKYHDRDESHNTKKSEQEIVVRRNDQYIGARSDLGRNASNLLYRESPRYDPKMVRKSINMPSSSRIDYDDDSINFYSDTNSIIGADIIKKFFVVFGAMLGIIIATWFIFYLVNGGSNIDERTVISPSNSNWKIKNKKEEDIQDKLLYDIVGYRNSIKNNAGTRDSHEVPNVEKLQGNKKNRYDASSVSDKHITSDKFVYYVNILKSYNMSRPGDTIEYLRKKYPFIDGSSIAVKTVVDLNGKQKDAILMGPFLSEDYAKDIASSVSIDFKCSVIKTRKA